MITRHFIDVGGRRVHYQRAGSGPPLLMVHQSPRSSAEFEPLMRRWAAHFTCIAPDTPGFGQSAPLPGTPEIDDFADATVTFMDAAGLGSVAAYGFHSGGIILVTALRRHRERFTALAVGGYAVWTPAERAVFSDAYLPPFRPSAYGEHLTWLWNRVLEQSWFFPWFDVRPEARLPLAHDDPVRVDAVVRDMLDSGDAYCAGYGAVLRAARDIPNAKEETAPVLITAYDGDPLQSHIDRLGPMPPCWSARKVATPAEHEAESLALLLRHPAPPCPPLVEAPDKGFRHIATNAFDGRIHWHGTPGAPLRVHGPGRAAELVEGSGMAIDMPGHGLSDPWPADAPTDRAAWNEVAVAMSGGAPVTWEEAPSGDPACLFPDLTPDRFGTHLTRAWSIARLRHLFSPWYEANAAHATPFDPAALDPERLARDHRALLRAPAARAYATALQGEPDGHS